MGEGDTGEDDWPWNAQQWGDQQPEPEMCSLGGQANASNSHLPTVTFRVDSEAEVTQ